jgi:hypothetical protein
MLTFQEISGALLNTQNDKIIQAIEQIINLNLIQSREHEFVSSVSQGVRDYSAGSASASVDLLTSMKLLIAGDTKNPRLDNLREAFQPKTTLVG